MEIDVCIDCGGVDLSSPTPEEIRKAGKGYGMDESWMKCNKCGKVFIIS